MLIRKICLVAVITACLCVFSADRTLGQATTVIDFEDLSLAEDAFVEEAFTSNGVFFDGQVADFGIYEGYVQSNLLFNQDLSTPPIPSGGFDPDLFDLQQYSAFNPSGSDHGNFAVLVFNESSVPQTDFVGAITAPTGTRFQSIQITNNVLAAFDIENGGGFGNGLPFDDDEDAFELFIGGFNDQGDQISQLVIDLASGADFIIDRFSEFSLAGLGDASQIQFSLTSTDTSDFDGDGQPDGLATPTFIAIDNLTFVAVPEPSAWLLLSIIAGGCGFCRRRK